MTCIDLKRAFDSVYLNGLFLKLNKSGIGGKTLKIIKSIYSNIKNRVRACNSYSDFFNCAVGLKQGEIMSPMLFSLFIEDLELFIQDSPTSGLTIDDSTFYTITICPSYDCSYNLWTNE